MHTKLHLENHILCLSILCLYFCQKYFCQNWQSSQAIFIVLFYILSFSLFEFIYYFLFEKKFFNSFFKNDEMLIFFILKKIDKVSTSTINP